jgi:hypothetical protein
MSIAAGLWGRSSAAAFYSGPGSHDETIVGPYVEAVRSFIGRLPAALDAVDLGCGDFNVGRQICHLFSSYIGGDVVAPLVAENQRRYADLDVSFRVVDIAADPLPSGDLVLVRQVLQHLSNADIGAALAKISAYEYAIITEHVPDGPFKPNIDKPSGAEIRLSLHSGVVVTEPPFSLEPVSQEILCEVPAFGGLIRTIAYRLR